MKIDHVTVCGNDLAKMRREFTEIGLETEYGGSHANGLTHMALAGFEDGSYLELIAPLPGMDRAQATGMMAEWMPLMMENAGAGAWAIQVSGIRARAEELRGRGIAVRGPERGGRTKPDGAQLEWETAVVGPGAAGPVLPFMIEDRTERSLRVRASANEIGVRGVAAVVVGVHDMRAACVLFQGAYGWGEASEEGQAACGAQLASFEGTPVILAAAQPQGSWLEERLQRFGDGPVGFLFKGNETAMTRLKIADECEWFGRKVGWCNEERAGARVGFIWE
jgi:hypothetical protein